MESAQQWAKQTFGDAELGDKRRTDRLVKMSSEAATRPGGRVTEVYREPSSQLASYRWVENEAIEPERVIEACGRSTVQRASDAERVFVPIDGSSLSLFDPNEIRNVGVVGAEQKGQPGLHMINAIALEEDGTPIGLCDQYWWAREPDEKRRTTRSRTRAFWDKESSHYLRAATKVEQRFEDQGNSAQLWFQIDRGGDFKEAWHWAGQTDHEVTIRINQTHRKVRCDGQECRIDEVTEGKSPDALRRVRLREGPDGESRCCWMELSWETVTFEVPAPGTSNPKEQVTLQVVHVRQIGEDIDEEDRLEWWLGTTHSVEDTEEAFEVIDGYKLRWRIEQFHRTWKSVCGVEETRLEEKNRIIRWAIILAGVAMRIERLKRVAREQPDADATIELSRPEIDALIFVREPEGWEPGETPTIGKVVRWIADLGGYANPHQGPPGTEVLQRGLDEIRPAVRLLEKADKLREYL